MPRPAQQPQQAFDPRGPAVTGPEALHYTRAWALEPKSLEHLLWDTTVDQTRAVGSFTAPPPFPRQQTLDLQPDVVGVFGEASAKWWRGTRLAVRGQQALVYFSK